MRPERMACPRCPGGDLREMERDGIIIDRCSACGGIWLDRGELERVLAREHASHAGGAGVSTDHGRPPIGSRRDDDDDDDDRMDRRSHESHDRSYEPRRKRGFLGALGDLFD